MSEPFDDYDGDYDNGLDEELEPDEETCSYGGPGMPAIGTEECDCWCPNSAMCWEIFNSRPECLVPTSTIDEAIWLMPCSYFYCGKCYVNGKRAWLVRLKCALGYPPVPREREGAEKT